MKNKVIEGFSLMGNKEAKILILGSMPGVKSIDEQQYYAHPQNAFWKIMTTLYHQDEILDYQLRKELLSTQRIALWDVLKFCERQGSLDANINKETMEANDFVSLFAEFPKISHVFFNGAMAESTYKKKVLPLVAKLYPSITYTKLPSTSPAYAAMKFAAKCQAWSVIKEC
ncbi:MAG: DNA-deoxyinosine glycosylase [Methyloprofundus sp.]|nr:DNA-deoxyinosine glycosylase [Methyloprofundus sp.]